MKNKRYEEGLKIRRLVLGNEYVDGAMIEQDEFSVMRHELITEYHWGSIWARKELPLKIRSLITIAMLSGMNRSHELKLHIRGAINTGCTKEEISEVFFHAGIYCGAAAPNEGLRILKEVMAEIEAKR
jgi:4-carboxymuconolactone decarboxylase